MGRRAVLASTAASLLAAGARPAGAQQNGRPGGERGDLKEVKLQGRLLALGELVARKYGAQTAGAGPEKQWGLVLPEGELYSLLDNAQYRKLLAAGLEGKAVEVEARQFPRSHFLEITAFRAIEEAALRRRFYCDVCAIYFDDFGPCVCCGEEVKLVREEN